MTGGLFVQQTILLLQIHLHYSSSFSSSSISIEILDKFSRTLLFAFVLAAVIPTEEFRSDWGPQSVRVRHSVLVARVVRRICECVCMCPLA